MKNGQLVRKEKARKNKGDKVQRSEDSHRKKSVRLTKNGQSSQHARNSDENFKHKNTNKKEQMIEASKVKHSNKSKRRKDRIENGILTGIKVELQSPIEKSTSKFIPKYHRVLSGTTKLATILPVRNKPLPPVPSLKLVYPERVINENISNFVPVHYKRI